VFSAKGTVLTAAHVISAATYTKLRRRYRGQPVEQATRDKLVEYFASRRNAAIDARLAAMNVDVETALLPATFRLTKQARDCAKDVPSFKRDITMKRDHIDDRQVARILRGAYAVHKHLHPIACHILRACQDLEIDLPGCDSADDLIEESDDHNICFPLAYRSPRGRRH
jgi:hypothetical protein